MTKKSIGLLGIGAIGSVISQILSENTSLNLYYFNRSPRQFIKLKKEDKTIEIPISCQTNIEKPLPLDWLIICLKEHHFEEAKGWFEKLIDKKTKVVVIRNGLQHQAAILKYTTSKKIIECIIDCPTQPTENGFYQQFRKPILTIPKSEISSEFSQLFLDNLAVVDAVEDFKTASWKKVCESSALGGILCLTGETCWIFQDKKMQNLYLKILKEAITVARADGAKIDSNFEDEMLQKLLKYPANKGSSMLTDRLNGRPIEVGAKNEIIVEWGEFYQIKTPINRLICVLLGVVNQSAKSLT